MAGRIPVVLNRVLVDGPLSEFCQEYGHGYSINLGHPHSNGFNPNYKGKIAYVLPPSIKEGDNMMIVDFFDEKEEVERTVKFPHPSSERLKIIADALTRVIAKRNNTTVEDLTKTV